MNNWMDMGLDDVVKALRSAADETFGPQLQQREIDGPLWFDNNGWEQDRFGANHDRNSSHRPPGTGQQMPQRGGYKDYNTAYVPRPPEYLGVVDYHNPLGASGTRARASTLWYDPTQVDYRRRPRVPVQES
jgi:hypothetical protein